VNTHAVSECSFGQMVIDLFLEDVGSSWGGIGGNWSVDIAGHSGMRLDGGV